MIRHRSKQMEDSVDVPASTITFERSKSLEKHTISIYVVVWYMCAMHVMEGGEEIILVKHSARPKEAFT